MGVIENTLSNTWAELNWQKKSMKIFKDKNVLCPDIDPF
jgi:hypothetical protein